MAPKAEKPAEKPRPQQIYTEEKALHLVRVYGAILSIMFLMAWQSLMLLNPLKKDKEIMAHMDPSEIIATPFPLNYVYPFTLAPVAVIFGMWLYRTPKKMLAKTLSLIKLSLVIFALFALCGNNMIQNWKHSLSSALYMGALLATTSTGKVTSNLLEELPFNDFSNFLAVCRLYGMIIISIPFHILMILDHGSQIQRWPLPVLMGGTFGYVIGSFVGLIGLYINNKSAKKAKV